MIQEKKAEKKRRKNLLKHIKTKSLSRPDKIQFYKKYLMNDYIQRRDPSQLEAMLKISSTKN